MKLFNISDVLSITTGRLVSSRHVAGIYDILNYLTNDNLFTHQLPRAMRECEPWLRVQFPDIMKDSPRMVTMLDALDQKLAPVGKDVNKITTIVISWVEEVRVAFNMPIDVPVYELGADMHAKIDPTTEAEQLIGKDRVIVVNVE